VKKKVTSIGTKVLRIAPLIKEITAISELVELEIKGRVVSMDVAPAGAIAVKKFSFVAKMGIVITAINSLKTFVKKAIVPISALHNLVSNTPERLYQPKPEAIANPVFMGNLSMRLVKKPPIKLPKIILRGINKTLNPSFFKSLINDLLLATSMPTRKIRI
jgi:hypothetical protein